ncbi:MAG TPA: glucosamine-6-phosphate deaminase, partial [Mycobacterium sp.]|nr:glucosamine-6-phosphate deaminase [Mycobacterium sp.]
MEVIIVEDPAAIGVIGAAAAEALLARKPAAVLGLATGS